MSGRAHRVGERRWVTVFLGLLAWFAALVYFFPVLWMAVTGLKREEDAVTDPPSLLFDPTLAEYGAVLDRGMAPYLLNSVMVSVTSTLLVLVLALPAAYSLSLRPVPRWRDALFFFITTKMLPVVAVIIPLYVVFRELHLLDTTYALIIVYAAMNLPIAVWMLRSFMLEVPKALLEAARVDGASFRRELVSVLAPIISPGIAATALICFIFAWNEFFFAVNLTSSRAGTVPVFLVGFITGEGLYWAKLSAAATLASLPVLLAGWTAQNKLVRGLSMGAVK